MARHQSGIVVAFCAAEDQTAYRGRVARKAYGVCVLQAEVGGPAILGGAFLCKLHQNQPHSESLQMHRRPNHVGDCRGTPLLSTEETQDLPLIMNGQICVFLFQL
jgi:hypothetical protein